MTSRSTSTLDRIKLRASAGHWKQKKSSKQIMAIALNRFLLLKELIADEMGRMRKLDCIDEQGRRCVYIEVAPGAQSKPPEVFDPSLLLPLRKQRGNERSALPELNWSSSWT